MAISQSGGTPPAQSGGGDPSKMSIGQLWHQVMIVGYLQALLASYDTVTQKLAPTMKQQLDTIYSQMDSLAEQIQQEANQMNGDPGHDGPIQAQITALNAEKSQLSTQADTINSTVGQILTRATATMQQLTGLISSLGQIMSAIQGMQASQ